MSDTPAQSRLSSSSTAVARESASTSALIAALGKTTIADTVVAKIASMAARQVPGVHALGGGPARVVGSLRERIPGGRTNHSQGVSVDVGERQTAVNVQLVAEYGVAIADLADGIRRAVISALARMTSLHVTEVNVEVQDVYLASADDQGDQRNEPRVK